MIPPPKKHPFYILRRWTAKGLVVISRAKVHELGQYVFTYDMYFISVLQCFNRCVLPTRVLTLSTYQRACVLSKVWGDQFFSSTLFWVVFQLHCCATHLRHAPLHFSACKRAGQTYLRPDLTQPFTRLYSVRLTSFFVGRNRRRSDSDVQAGWQLQQKSAHHQTLSPTSPIPSSRANTASSSPPS